MLPDIGGWGRVELYFVYKFRLQTVSSFARHHDQVQTIAVEFRSAGDTTSTAWLQYSLAISAQ